MGKIIDKNNEKLSTQFLLVRHGETEWNKEQRLQGQLDSPLTDKGIQQIESLAQLLSSQQIDRDINQIISSPLNRAVHSAKIIQQLIPKPLSYLEPLKERSFGDWQGQLFDEIKDDLSFSDVFFKVNNTPITNGESAIFARKRLTSALTSLVEKFSGQRILVVTHGELLRCFLSGLENGVDGSAYELFKNGKVFEVHYLHHQRQFVSVQQ